MKHWLSKSTMILRIAFKNIRFSPLRAIIFTMSLTMMSALTMMVISLKPFVESYYYHAVEEVYHDIDFYLTYDENTNARFFSIQALEKRFDLKKDFQFVAPVFKSTSLLQVNNSHQYVHVIASSANHLNHLTRRNIPPLKAQEMIVSSALSEAYRLSVGDQVSLLIGDEKIPFTIVNILASDGIFQDNTVLINKDDNLSYYLKSMGIHLPAHFTRNIYNTVYFSLHDTDDPDTMKAKIAAIDDYSSYKIMDAYPMEAIRANASRTASIMYLLFCVLMIAVVLVIQSTYRILLDERKPFMQTLNSLGSGPLFPFMIILGEWLIYLSVSTILGAYITRTIVRHGLSYIGSSFVFPVDLRVVFYSFMILLAYVLLMTGWSYPSIKQQTIVSLMDQERVMKPKNGLIYLVLFIGSVIGFVICTVVLKFPLRYTRYHSLIRFLLGIFIIYSGSHALIDRLSLLIHRRKRGIFSIYFVKELKNNRVIHHVRHLLMISFGLIALLVSSKQVIRSEVETIAKQFSSDFALMNVMHQQEQIEAALNHHDDVSDVDPAVYLKDIEWKDQGIRISYMIAMDIHRLKRYIDYDLDEAAIRYMESQSIPYIVLPDKFHYLYHLEVGDLIHLRISEEYPDEKFFVAGFSTIGYWDYAITNLHQLPDYEPLKANAFFINARNNKRSLREALITTYSKEMIFVADIQKMNQTTTQQIVALTEYFSFVLLVVAFGFLLSIINQLTLVYLRLKRQLSKLMAIGYTEWQLIHGFIKMNVVMILVICSMILAMFIPLTKELPFLLLFFDTYQPLTYDIISGVNGIIAGGIMFVICICYLVIHLKKQTLVNELKYY